MIKTGPKWGNTIHLYILPTILKQSWEYDPFALALYTIAKGLRAIDSILLLTSPLAQHFAGNDRGYYNNYSEIHSSNSNDKNNNNNNNNNNDNNSNNLRRVCSPWKSDTAAAPIIEHPDTMQIKASLAKIDPNWQTLIGFIDLELISKDWFDLHPESRATGWRRDCTHYVYNPRMFDIIWYYLSEYIAKRDSPWISFLYEKYVK